MDVVDSEFKMASEIVKSWFGDEFSRLAPELQDLHVNGGVLEGEVNIQTGKGMGGFIGKRLSKKLNLPDPGVNRLTVKITHSGDGLHWDRKFNDAVDMKSTFEPVGSIGDGYWIEKTGPLHMRLTVDIVDTGWHWRCLGFRIFGVPLPVWLFPESQAYKYIENGGYKFFVGFRAPLVGLLLSYEGVLAKR